MPLTISIFIFFFASLYFTFCEDMHHHIIMLVITFTHVWVLIFFFIIIVVFFFSLYRFFGFVWSLITLLDIVSWSIVLSDCLMLLYFNLVIMDDCFWFIYLYVNIYYSLFIRWSKSQYFTTMLFIISAKFRVSYDKFISGILKLLLLLLKLVF